MISSDGAFKTAIFNALCGCLGLSPLSSDAKAKIREAYTEPENSPRPARNADVIYWNAYPNDSIDDPAIEGSIIPPQTFAQQKATVFRPLVYTLLIICYGPAAEANAVNIRSFLFIDGNGLPRQILRKAGIYPISRPAPPDLLYEPEGSLWRRRADLKVDLIIKDERTISESRGTIRNGPFVILKH